MKFGDVHNPKAAADSIKAFRARFSASVCLAPERNCQGKIIAAHTLSAQAMLRPIARDGHVYTVDFDLFHSGAGNPSRMVLKGIKDTSVFNGFCAHHDKQLFAPIEDQPFICSPEQLFTHAYRAVAKESYLKRKQAESLPSPEVVKDIHGIPASEPLVFSEVAKLHITASLRGAEDIERIKAKMDAIWIAKEWRRLVTVVVPFSRPPTIVCSFPYSPDFDFSGNCLQSFEDFETDMDHLIVTVAPSNSGGYVFFSALDTSWKTAKKVVDSWLAQTDRSSRLVQLILTYCENFAISPDWYESLSEIKRAALLSVFSQNADLFNRGASYLTCEPVAVDDWGFQSPFQM